MNINVISPDSAYEYEILRDKENAIRWSWWMGKWRQDGLGPGTLGGGSLASLPAEERCPAHVW